MQLLGTVEIKWLKLAGCCKLAGGNDRNCTSTLTLIDQPVRNWSVVIFLLLRAYCFYSKDHFKSSIDLGSCFYVPHLNTLLMCFISISELFHLVKQEAQSTSVLKLVFVLQNSIPFRFIYFTFSFVDIYANMLLFRVKPYLCYPLDSGML